MDNETMGTGNMINYKYRVHDVRIGRFLSIDPLTASYPHNSPYAFSENRVIDGRELEGKEWIDYRLTFDNGGKPSLKLIDKQYTYKSIWLKERQNLPLVYWIEYGGQMYSFSETGNVLYSPGNTIENLWNWVMNDGSAGGFTSNFVSQKQKSHMLADDMLDEWTEGLIYASAGRGSRGSQELKTLRSRYREIGAKRNIAWVEGSGNLQGFRIVANSAKFSPKGTAPVPQNRIFKTNKGTTYNKFDSEVKILEEFARIFPERNISGTLNLYSERPYCSSCRNIIFEQFNKVYPNVNIVPQADGIITGEAIFLPDISSSSSSSSTDVDLEYSVTHGP